MQEQESLTKVVKNNLINNPQHILKSLERILTKQLLNSMKHAYSLSGRVGKTVSVKLLATKCFKI